MVKVESCLNCTYKGHRQNTVQALMYNVMLDGWITNVANEDRVCIKPGLLYTLAHHQLIPRKNKWPGYVHNNKGQVI